MAATTAPRDTAKKDDSVIPQLLTFPVAANVNIHQGSFVYLDSAGNARPGRGTLSDMPLGRCDTPEGAVPGLGGNNLTVSGGWAGTAGLLSVQVRQGCFKWANGSSSIAQANAGQLCFGVDDQTVQLTDADGTLPVAGIIVQVDSDGVFVSTFLNAGSQVASIPAPQYSMLSIYMPLAGIASGDQVAKIIPGFAGKIVSTQALVIAAATTAAKAATLTPQINVAAGADAPVTGGVLALTSANMTPIGAVVAGTAVTAANTFGSTDGISLKASSVTTFVEGAASIILTIQATP